MKLAERDPAHGVGHHRAAERHVGGELRPRRERLLDLDQRGRHAILEARRVEDAHHVRDLLLGRQAASSAEVTSPSSPWKGGRSGSRSKRSTSSMPRWLVAITTGPAGGARVLAQAHLHLQVVALVDDHVDARDELRDRRLLDPAGIGDDSTYGSSSEISRAARTTLFTPTSATPPVSRFRFERSARRSRRAAAPRRCPRAPAWTRPRARPTGPRRRCAPAQPLAVPRT